MVANSDCEIEHVCNQYFTARVTTGGPHEAQRRQQVLVHFHAVRPRGEQHAPGGDDWELDQQEERGHARLQQAEVRAKLPA